MVGCRFRFHIAGEINEMATGKKPASDAGKQLGKTSSTAKEKEALSQAPKKGSKATPPAKKK